MSTFSWRVCFGLTGLAIVIAFLDARVLQHRTHQEQRDLFEKILKQIEAEAKPGPAGLTANRESRSRDRCDCVLLVSPATVQPDALRGRRNAAVPPVHHRSAAMAASTLQACCKHV